MTREEFNTWFDAEFPAEQFQSLGGAFRLALRDDVAFKAYEKGRENGFTLHVDTISNGGITLTSDAAEARKEYAMREIWPLIWGRIDRSAFDYAKRQLPGEAARTHTRNMARLFVKDAQYFAKGLGFELSRSELLMLLFREFRMPDVDSFDAIDNAGVAA